MVRQRRKPQARRAIQAHTHTHTHTHVYLTKQATRKGEAPIVLATSSAKIPRLVGRIRSGPSLVGRLGSGVRISISFHNEPSDKWTLGQRTLCLLSLSYWSWRLSRDVLYRCKTISSSHIYAENVNLHFVKCYFSYFIYSMMKVEKKIKR